MNDTTVKIQSPRNPKTNEMDAIYEEFAEAIRTFRESPTDENQKSLEAIQKKVEATEDAYHQGRFALLKREMAKMGILGPIRYDGPVPFSHCIHGYVSGECEVCND